MPIYDYLCSTCDERTEVIHGITAPGPRFCPVCGAEGTLRKALVAPAVHFKGSGWAKKDRSTATKARAKSESGAETGAARAGKSSGDGSPSNGPTLTSTPSASPPSDSTSSGDSGSSSSSSPASSDAAAG